jgi:hypothetical protein
VPATLAGALRNHWWSIGRLGQIGAEIFAIQDLDVFADAERRADLRDKLAIDVVDFDLARRRPPLALLGIVSRERAG